MFSFYVAFKSNLLKEHYFNCIKSKCYRNALIKVRLGVLPINSNKLRYSEDGRKKSCVISVKHRWMMNSILSVCVRCVTVSGLSTLVLICAREILLQDCVFVIWKKPAGSSLWLLFTPVNLDSSTFHVS